MGKIIIFIVIKESQNVDASPEIDNLCAAIFDAWSVVTCPGTDDIIVNHAEDESDIREYLQGTRQQGHSPSKLASLSAAFSFFTPSAWHYWIPSFMVAALRTDGDIDVSADRLALSFVDWNSCNRLPLLSQRQADLVGEYLRNRKGSLSCSEVEAEVFKKWTEAR